MCARFLYFAVITLLAAVFVPESYAARKRNGMLKCAGDGTCKYWCFKPESFTGTKCGSLQYCCKINQSPNTQKTSCEEKFGGTCINFKSSCGDNETILVGACISKSMKCCKAKPPNAQFQDGVYRIVKGNARVAAGRKAGGRGVNTRRRRLQ